MKLYWSVEDPQYLLVVAQANGFEEYAGKEFPLPVHSYIEIVFGIVFIFHPGAAVGDYLSVMEAIAIVQVEKGPWGTMQLAYYYPFGTIYYKSSVFGHQRDLTEVYLLLFYVANGPGTCLGVFFPADQPNGYLEGHSIGHPPLLALLHIVFNLQPDPLSAGRATAGLLSVCGTTIGADQYLFSL